jgi:hypothetical protein
MELLPCVAGPTTVWSHSKTPTSGAWRTGRQNSQFAWVNLKLLSSYSFRLQMYLRKIMIITPLLKWYLLKGLVVTRIYQVVEYSAATCFQNFAKLL